MRAVACFLPALCMASVLAASAAAQQLYRSVGPDGRVVYSDRPPVDGRKAEKVTSSRMSSVSPGAAAAAAGDAAKASGPKSLAEQEQAFRQRRIETEEKARKNEKLAEEQRAKSQACAAMRREVAGMQSGARIARTTASGEREYLDDAQIQQEVARMERDIAASCK